MCHNGSSVLFLFILSTEMQNMQSAAREHTQRVFQETDLLRKQLVEKESNIQRRSRQLSELVAQTDMERKKLENERKKVRLYTCFS
jgi:Skp family chaperone for outer membrane proteins